MNIINDRRTFELSKKELSNVPPAPLPLTSYLSPSLSLSPSISLNLPPSLSLNLSLSLFHISDCGKHTVRKMALSLSRPIFTTRNHSVIVYKGRS
jgi:hypothetical protein